ncbi:hypothetical protein [Vacuolonema iberomarrocanum]|uniref:hypothetical protein n=1 Tax=Vacuolonema iberomarrocanum TaxID=3454632 RepID=UPI0019DA8104|nr:hypothetical protein [filamentous cyanobacterium LEGE 07170]
MPESIWFVMGDCSSRLKFAGIESAIAFLINHKTKIRKISSRAHSKAAVRWFLWLKLE